jgi:hypothetical protein
MSIVKDRYIASQWNRIPRPGRPAPMPQQGPNRRYEETKEKAEVLEYLVKVLEAPRERMTERALGIDEHLDEYRKRGAEMAVLDQIERQLQPGQTVRVNFDNWNKETGEWEGISVDRTDENAVGSYRDPNAEHDTVLASKPGPRKDVCYINPPEKKETTRFTVVIRPH